MNLFGCLWQAALHFGLFLLRSPTGLEYLGPTMQFYGVRGNSALHLHFPVALSPSLNCIW